ncbi:hypothetical protein F66182_1274 [Fusarium sp. NRRL 66182]|nr:hypothetical protein F66182_1274 [Fusarium sp. NRRL 66182]
MPAESLSPSLLPPFIASSLTKSVPPVPVVIDTEKGEGGESPRVSKCDKLKTWFPAKKMLIGFVLFTCLLAVMFGMGVLGACYFEKKLSEDGLVGVQVGASDQGHHRVRRNEVVDASYPISTMTTLSTIYGIRTAVPEVVTEIETVTGTTYVTVPGEDVHVSIAVTTIESSTEVCEIEVVTMTESYTVTVTPGGGYSATSAALPEATVIGNPSTVTSLHTELSLTSGLVDATVSGNPDTVTSIKTDYSVTSGLPDATVPGNPETVTDIRTDYSLSTNLPDATVPGNPETVTEDRTGYSLSSDLPDATISGYPSTVTETQQSFSLTGSIHTVVTITDLYPPKQDLSTVTAVTTIHRTLTTQQSIVTITVTDVYQESITSAPISPTSTLTKVVYKTAGEASTSTKTIQVPASPYPPYPPYPTANNTMLPGPSGSVTVLPTVPTPVVISGGTKKPEPRGWGGSSGTTNVGCTIMLIAVIMLVL